MSSERHDKQQELFLQARALTGAERERYLDEACEGDALLRKDVLSLLANDLSATILSPPPGSHPKVLSRATTRTAEGKRRSRLGDIAVTLRERWRGTLAGIAVLLLFVAFSRWTSDRVESALEELVANKLRFIRDAEVSAVTQWLESLELKARSVAARSEVRDSVAALRELTQGVTDDELGALVLPSEQLQAVQDALASILRGDDAPVIRPARRFDDYAIVDGDGRVVALGGHLLEVGASLGRRVEGSGRETLQRVLTGESRLMMPFILGSRAGREMDLPAVPIMSVVTPITDGADVPLAALVLLVDPSQEFTQLLDIAYPGGSTETYAFDADANMLSESHFGEQLRKLGLLTLDQRSSVLALTLKDPGVDLTRNETPTLTRTDMPRTRMAVQAIDERGSGEDIVGYRDYRGVLVVGAWTWLDEYEFGIAVEIDHAEAYEAVSLLKQSMLWLQLLLALTGLGLLGAAYAIVHLRESIDRSRRLGQYTLGSLLGEGGMGAVYQAQHALLRRPTAIKLLKPACITPESLARFEREVQLTCQLTHPNTIEIYDFGRTQDGAFYYAMELLPGLTLHDLVTRFGALGQARTVHVLLQICGSLEEAHDQGLVHRDVKPMNIFLCRRGGHADVVKVLDFGLVKDLGSTDDVQLTAPQAVSGSPLFMAPERFENPSEVDARSDIWAVGCIGYYLLTGRDAFPGKNVSEVWKKVVNDPAPRPSQHARERLSPALEDLLLKCLEKDPARRPAHIRELIAGLEGLTDVPSWTRQDADHWWQEHAPDE
jgi:hypothetical protein